MGAHAALVLDAATAVQGWCQYGSPEELPSIKHRREYAKDAPARPDWRNAGIFVDKKHRGRGLREPHCAAPSIRSPVPAVASSRRSPR